MSRQTTTPTETPPPLLALQAFAVQALASLSLWFAVNDMSRGTGVFYNKDLSEWAMLSVVCSVSIVAVARLVLHRRLAVLAVAIGCLLALMSGLAIFVAWAVVNSA